MTMLLTPLSLSSSLRVFITSMQVITVWAEGAGAESQTRRWLARRCRKRAHQLLQWLFQLRLHERKSRRRLLDRQQIQGAVRELDAGVVPQI